MSDTVDIRRDFRSDTVTEPTQAMREAMARAKVGDDVLGHDPTTCALEERVARLLGKSAALFFPSGCMANLAGLMSLAEPGRALYVGQHAHIKLFELGSYARIGGLHLISVDDQQGYLDRHDLDAKWLPDVYYMAQPGVVAVENSHNILGGLVYPPMELKDLRRFTDDRGVPLHLDGARLFHAAAYQGCDVTDWTMHVDSVMVCISKGLGAPVGSLLAGSEAMIQKARVLRKLLGGGMRQSGVLAAAGLFALDHHLPLLAEDNRRCAWVFEQLCSLDWLEATKPETNILVLSLREPRAVEFSQFLMARNLAVIPFDASMVRLVFHLHHTDAVCQELVEAFESWGRT